MAVAGTGCFIAWYNLRPGGEADHDEWHTKEHMIERVALPGFLQGFRYRSAEDAPRVCVIYRAISVTTFTAATYLERLNNPTPWTKQVMPLVVDMNRTLCSVVSRFGHGTGGHLLTLQLSVEPGRAQQLRDQLSSRTLPNLTAKRGLCSSQLLVGDQAASQTNTQEKILRGTPDAVADWVVLVEGYDADAVAAARSDLMRALPDMGGDELVPGLFTLDFTMGEDEAGELWSKLGC